MDEEIIKEIKYQVLKNALEYKKADANKVIGKIISQFPDKKNQIKEILELTKKEVERINSLNPEELEQEAKKYNVQKEVEKKIKEDFKFYKINLPEAKRGEVITRFPPEPSGYLHIGHAKAICLDYYAALEYEGKMLLRFDDTNPQKAKQEYVDLIKKEIEWLGIQPYKESYSSDYIPTLYNYAKEIIKLGRAYVCNCSAQEIKENRIKKIRCSCTRKTSSKNLEDFQAMINGEYNQAEAILRFVGDMESENTVMHDPTLFRIIKAFHYRQKEKYVCWPTYDFAAPILDSIEGVTHAMRSKEYELRDELYYKILEILRLRKPTVVSFSRLAIKGMPVSKRLITPLIEQKLVEGYDDPRLPTLAAFRRRGIKAEAIKEFVLAFGLTKVESEPNLEKLLAINKKLIDGSSQRRFFVPWPYAKIKLQLLTEFRQLSIKNHPISNLGQRIIEIKNGQIVYVPAADVENLKEGERIRLKDFCSIVITKKEMKKDELYLEAKEISGGILENEKKIQWVKEDEKILAKVYIPKELYVEEKYNPNSLEIVEGFVEKSCQQDKEGQIVQFERFGFVILDKKEDSYLKYIFSCK
ncbi:MAG: glutamate--tRNA ligase [Candidatus Micrarchaeota archaeon]|nr:glutamate--tRNA ligase [Candidatus Micrarchaeota archaeon]